MRFAIAAFLLAACGSSSNATDQRAPEPGEPQVAVPEVAGNGYSALPADRVAVVITKNGLVFDGQPIVPIANGKVDPAELEGGALGIKINKLGRHAATFVERRRTERPGADPTFAISMDPSLPYRLLISTMFSIKSAPAKRFAIVARAGGSLVAAPITLPEKRAAAMAFVTGVQSGGRRPGADLAKQIEDVKNGRRTDEADVLEPPFKTIRKATVAPASTLSGETVGVKITSAYIAGIRRCAAKKPGHHALELELAIDTGGRASVKRLGGETGEVADCLGGLVSAWRFPIAKDTGGTAIAVIATIGIELDVQTPTKAVPKPAGRQATEEADAEAFADKLILEPIDAPPSDQPIQLFVSITKRELLVWSTSGLEGTLRDPKARIELGPKAMDGLSKVLAEIVQRRWANPDHPRAPDTKTIVIQADGDTPIQIVAQVMGAVRAGQDGRELFPDILLSSGFE